MSPTPSLLPDAARSHRVTVRAQRALRVSRKDLRLDRDRYAQVRVRCALPCGEICVSVRKASTSTGDSVGTVRVKVRAGKRKQVRFRLPESRHDGSTVPECSAWTSGRP